MPVSKPADSSLAEQAAAGTAVPSEPAPLTLECVIPSVELDQAPQCTKVVKPVTFSSEFSAPSAKCHPLKFQAPFFFLPAEAPT